MKRKQHKRACFKITQEHVYQVREAIRRFPNATNAEIAKFCGLGKSTVESIKRGKYDEPQKHNSDCTDKMLCPFNGMNECTTRCDLFMADSWKHGRCGMAMLAHATVMPDMGMLAQPVNNIPYDIYAD